MLATISIDLIEDGQRLRDVSEATVAALVNSIADVGLLNPISVYRRTVYRPGPVDGYGLVAGLHRKTACERLGLVDIEANILELDDLNRQIAECDENLCGSTLTPSEKARFTKRRKEAYEALHPETKQGANYQCGQFGHTEAESFVDATSKATGASDRAVRRDAERGEKVDDRALDLLKHTKLDTGTYLDTLKALPKADQVKQVRRDLAKPKPKLTKSQITAAQVKALVDAWNKAGVPARTEFLTHLGVTINTPAHTSGGPAKDTEPVVSDAENSTAAGMDRHEDGVRTQAGLADSTGTPGSPQMDRPVRDHGAAVLPNSEADTQALPVEANQEPEAVTHTDALSSGAAPGNAAVPPAPEPEFEAVIDTPTFAEAAAVVFEDDIIDPNCKRPDLCRAFSTYGLCEDCRIAAGIEPAEEAA